MTTPRAPAADRHGSAAQARFLALLDGGEEGVHVAVQDLAHALTLARIVNMPGWG